MCSGKFMCSIFKIKKTIKKNTIPQREAFNMQTKKHNTVQKERGGGAIFEAELCNAPSLFEKMKSSHN